MNYINFFKNTYFICQAERKGEFWVRYPDNTQIKSVIIVSNLEVNSINFHAMINNPILSFNNFLIIFAESRYKKSIKGYSTFIYNKESCSFVEEIPDLLITYINEIGIGLNGYESIKAFDINTKVFLWENVGESSLIRYFDSKFVIGIDRRNINVRALDLITGQNLWTINLADFDYKTDIGFIKADGKSFNRVGDILWIPLEDGSFILLDALSGTFIKHIINPNPVANAVSGYYHSAKLNRMVKLHNNHFHQIDMDTHEVRYWDIQDIPKGMVKAADDTHIYMLDWKRPIFYAFNIEMRCIDFAWAVPDDIKVQMTSPLISVQLSEDYVFAGTLNSEFLFVFDKENGKVA